MVKTLRKKDEMTSEKLPEELITRFSSKAGDCG